MKIYQYHIIIRIIGFLFTLAGLSVIALTFAGVIGDRLDVLTLQFCMGAGLGFIFSCVGWSCYHSDYIIITESGVEHFVATGFGYLKKLIPIVEIVDFTLQKTIINGRRKTREGQEIVMHLRDGSKIIVKEANSESSQKKLLEEIKQKIGTIV